MVDSRNNSIAKVGRADKIAAQAMLARVYMAKAGFPLNDNASLSLAETELKAVIVYAEANGKYWAPDSTEWKNNGYLQTNTITNILFLLFNIVPVEAVIPPCLILATHYLPLIQAEEFSEMIFSLKRV